MAVLVEPAADALDYLRREAWDVDGDRTVYHLVLRVAEVLLGTRIDLDDMAVRIRNHHGVVHSGQELAEKRLAVFWNE